MLIKIVKRLTEKYPIIKTLFYPVILIRRLFIKKFDKQKSQRQIINNLSEILVNDIIITVPEFQGIFSISSRSDIFFRIISTKAYEPELVKLCLRYMDRNKDIIDVGANIGFYSVLFAKNLDSTSRVLAIEPTKNGIKRLLYNLELNEVNQRVEVFEGAASIHNGEAVIETIEGKEEYSSLVKIKYRGLETEKINKDKVKCITLDTLVKEKKLNPGLIKIDVEGSEYLVFQGALNIFLTYRPIILSEVCEEYLQKGGSSVKEVIQLIKSYKYDVFDVKNPSAPLGNASENYPKASNILCFPKELKIKSLK